MTYIGRLSHFLACLDSGLGDLASTTLVGLDDAIDVSAIRRREKVETGRFYLLMTPTATV